MFRSFRAFGLVLAAGLVLTGSVRADLLDAEMNKKMPEIVTELSKKYKNVGVLRFRVRDAGGNETFNAPMSGRMAQRLETLLTIHAGDKDNKPRIGVIRNPGFSAVKARIVDWYGKPADRKKLFTVTYPLAWSNQTVTPDVFLTGKVETSKDRTKTTVIVEYFDKDEPMKFKELAKFEQTTSVTILREMGHGFTLSRGAKSELKATKRSATQEAAKYAIRQLTIPSRSEEQTKSDQPRQSRQVSPKQIGGIEFEMVVDGKVTHPRALDSEDQYKYWEIDSPAGGSEVAFRLRNTTDRWLGVVLKLNGINTINESTGEALTSPKWVIPPGKSYLIKGFYEFPAPQDGSPMHKPFKVLVGSEAQQYPNQQMGEKRGLIEIDVFEQGPDNGQDDEPEMYVSPRGLPPSALKRDRATYQSYKSALLKNARLTTRTVSVRQGSLVVKRELIVPDTEAIKAEGTMLHHKELPNPMPVGGLTIYVLPDWTTFDE